MKPVVKVIAALTILAGSAAVTKIVAAHHAMVMYDRSTTVTLNGTVVELQWTNPHVFLLVNGKIDQGEQCQFAVRGLAARNQRPGKPDASGGMVGDGAEARRSRQRPDKSDAGTRPAQCASDQGHFGRHRPGARRVLSRSRPAPSAVTGEIASRRAPKASLGIRSVAKRSD